MPTLELIEVLFIGWIQGTKSSGVLHLIESSSKAFRYCVATCDMIVSNIGSYSHYVSFVKRTSRLG